MRAPSVSGWLALVLCAVAGISTALALGLHEYGLREDLSRLTGEHLRQAGVTTEHLLRLHLESALRRYRASIQTPELRANLELSHVPSVKYFAERLSKQHGARALVFLRSKGRVAAAGDPALADAALARLQVLSSGNASCVAEQGFVCGDGSAEDRSFALAHDGHFYAVVFAPLRAGKRTQGHLLAVEEIAPATLAEWSALTLARVSVSAEGSTDQISLLVGPLGQGALRVEVSGDAERRALANARVNLLTSGAVALLVAFAASLLLARTLVRPIQHIGDASRRIHSGDLAVRLRSRRSDELGDVARAFDAMLDRMQAALEGLARAQHLAQLGSWTLELGSGAVTCSAELRRICGLPADQRLDLATLLERCVHPADHARVRDAMTRCIRDGTPFRLDHRTLANDDATRLMHTQGERILEAGQPARMDVTMQDVTERRLVEEQLRYLAEHDGLTGLGNRRLFTEQLTVMLGEARLQPRGLAVIVLGIDGLKVINDTLGPSWGDRALEEVAQRLATVATPHLSLARIGDEEFAALYGNAPTPSDVARIARRMLRALQAPLELDDRELFIGGSAGIALWPNDGSEPEALLRSAGAALHDAEQHGRGTHRFYDESLNAVALKRLALEEGMRRALESGEFELHFQPLLELESGRVASVEALLRWRDPERGLISPADFIPVAEETGLIHEVGVWVLRAAAMQLASWKSTPLRDVRIAINVSAAQLESSEFTTQLEQLIRELGLHPQLLALELTESLLPSDPAAASALLERIAGLGSTIALDDFGIGFSSLSALCQLPIDAVKLDRSFARSLATDERSAQLVGAVVALAHGLGLRATIEGIENAEQLEIARELGCDAVQGYLVSAPISAADLPTVVAEIERGSWSKHFESAP